MALDAPARAAAATLLEIAQTRLELAATEVVAERAHWSRQAATAVLALGAGSAGAVLAVAALAWWYPPEQRALVLAVGAAALILLALVLIYVRRQRDRQHRPLLADTLTLLREDVAVLRGTPPR